MLILDFCRVSTRCSTRLEDRERLIKFIPLPFPFFFFLFREWNHGDIQKLIKKESKHRKFIVRKNDSYICYQKFHDRILSPYTSNSKIGSLRNSGERNVGIKSRYRSELLRLIYAEPPPLSATAWNRRGLRRFDGLDAC